MTTFIQALGTVLKSQVTKYVLLGDSDHGEKSIKCLAKAVKDGSLQTLDKYNVSTVMIEGPWAGSETSFMGGLYAKAVLILSKKGVRVVGCEDAGSEDTKRLQKALCKNHKDFKPWQVNVIFDELIAKRIPDANKSWLKQAERVKPKVIICCGTSHLPEFTHPSQKDKGLVKELHRKGCCYGFAIEASNTGDPYWYEPEKGKGFGRVECIAPYPGWNTL